MRVVMVPPVALEMSRGLVLVVRCEVRPHLVTPCRDKRDGVGERKDESVAERYEDRTREMAMVHHNRAPHARNCLWCVCEARGELRISARQKYIYIYIESLTGKTLSRKKGGTRVSWNSNATEGGILTRPAR